MNLYLNGVPQVVYLNGIEYWLHTGYPFDNVDGTQLISSDGHILTALDDVIIVTKEG